MGLGNFSKAKGVGAGVYECRINFGPLYRVYFGKDGERILVLLGGEQNNASRTTSGSQSNGGRTTNRGRGKRKKGDENGSDERFQRNGSGAGQT